MSDGVIALRRLLVAAPPVVTLVPVVQIMAGELPENSPPPAMGLSSLSRVPWSELAQGNTRRWRERVQVTAHGATRKQMRAILKAAIDAGDEVLAPAADGLSEIVVQLDSAGPERQDPVAKIWIGSQDFLVSYNEARG